jgi:RimJ/RimL family protein N-acetyltransferase
MMPVDPEPGAATVSFRPLAAADLPLLYEWLRRPHVSRWWGRPESLSEVEQDFLPLTEAASTTRCYVALLDRRPLGFTQSYVVAGAGDGWWEEETDSGARGIDQFLAEADDLGQGLGRRMIECFVDRLFLDPTVTKVQTDPAPDNERAIRCYARAGFVPLREVTTPDGPALLMVRYRSRPHRSDAQTART